MTTHKASTNIRITSEGDDPLESVRKAVAFADQMIALGAQVSVVGDLALTIRFDPVTTNVGPDQQDTAHEIAHDHARRVAGVGS